MKLSQHPFNASLGFKFTHALSNPVCFCLLLVAATLLAYQPVWHAGFIWDDDVYVTGNPLLTAPDGLRRIWFSLDSPSQYFPLTYTTFRIERTLWGLNAAGYHWINILLHAANVLLVWRLLRRLSVPGAWLGAAIFALHPVQVESVAWITEQKNILSLFFILLTLLAWIEFVDERPKRTWRFYLLALIFYALALFSKTTACTLPAALLLVLWLKRRPINWSRLAQIVPFLMMGAGMGLVTVLWERYHQGAQGKFFSLGLLERLLVAGHAIWFYAGKLLWPVNLTFSYPRWILNPADPVAYGWLVAVVGLGVAIYFARRFTGRSVEVAALFYVTTLSPLLGFIMLYTFRYSFVADHYQYTASIGPIALAGAGIVKVIGYFEKRTRFLRPVFCGALLLTLGVLTWRQSATYVNAETLWRTTLIRNPDCWMGYNNLGLVLAREGKFDQAISYWQKSLEIEPENAEAYKNLGLVSAQRGEMDGAISLWQKSLEIEPDDADIHYNIGVAYFIKGQTDKAIVHFQKALEIQPNLALAHNNLGLALFKKGWIDKAIVHYRKALEIQPNYATAHNNLGFALFKKGQVMEAIIHWQKTLELQPQNMDARNNLAWVLATCPETALRNGGKAVELAQQANQLSGGENPMILQTLAAAYAEVGRFPEAITTARHALQLATTQTNSDLINDLQAQTGFYEAGLPFHDTNQTNIEVHSNQP